MRDQNNSLLDRVRGDVSKLWVDCYLLARSRAVSFCWWSGEQPSTYAQKTKQAVKAESKP